MRDLNDQLGLGEAMLAAKVFEDRRYVLSESSICARSEWLRQW